jgi:trimeric autotransporter adhesin
MRMKSFTFCIAIVATLTAAPGLMGCNNKNDTLTQVTITPAGQYMAKNTTQQFTANGTFSNGMIINFTQVVNWSSSDTSVATVNNTAGQNGIVTSSLTTTGTTILTAFDVANNITGTALLTVDDPSSIQIVPNNSFMPVGGIHQFTAIALFTGVTVTQVITTYAKWTALSLSPGVAITDTVGVVGNGTVTVTAAAVPGTTVIQAADLNGSAAGTANITITSTQLAAITVSPINPIISMSTTTQQQFTAIGTFQDGTTTQTLTPSVDASWAWSSSNTAVATINYYTGLATAVAPGAVTITATDLITGVTGNTTLTFQ